MNWYEAARWMLIGIGLFCAGYFCLTWTPGAMKVRGIGGWQMIDTAGWVWAGFLLLGLSTYTSLTSDVIQPPDLTETIRRLLILAFIDFVIVVRAVRWMQIQRDVRREGVHAGA